MQNKDFEFTIEAGKAERHYWMDLWRYRELFCILVWRDIVVQYKQRIIDFIHFRKQKKRLWMQRGFRLLFITSIKVYTRPALNLEKSVATDCNSLMH